MDRRAVFTALTLLQTVILEGGTWTGPDFTGTWKECSTFHSSPNYLFPLFFLRIVCFAFMELPTNAKGIDRPDHIDHGEVGLQDSSDQAARLSPRFPQDRLVMWAGCLPSRASISSPVKSE